MIIDNIFKYIDFKSCSAYKFSKDIAVSNGYLVKTRQNKGNVGGHILERIVSSCPDLNPEWLLTGRGEMIKGNSINNILPIPNNPIVVDSETKKIELLSNKVSKKKIKEKGDVKFIQSNKFFIDASHAMTVNDNSMFPKYKKNSVVFLQELSESKLVLSNKEYVIETKEYRVLKLVIDSSINKTWTCCSLNNERHLHNNKLIHESFSVPCDAVSKFYLVLGQLQRN